MCTIAILIDVVDGAPLVLAANRDEVYARPTRSPEVLMTSPRIAGGVDALSGGTWLALRADGHFAAVTNQRMSGENCNWYGSMMPVSVDWICAVRGSMNVMELPPALPTSRERSSGER